MVDVLRPSKLSEALSWRKETGALPFAGGTDIMVRERGYTGTGPRIDRPVLFLDDVKELRTIAVGTFASGSVLSIGAAATLSEIEKHPDVPEPLGESVRLIAATGLRNRATLAGNVCNASPAGDSIPPLYVLNAEVVLAREGEVRTVPISEFLTGPGKTILRDDEILIAVRVPIGEAITAYYRKVGTRAANALSKLSAAGVAKRDKAGVVTDFRLALGAVGPVVVRVREAEAIVVGRPAKEIDVEKVVQAYEPHIRPISDQRSTAEYRGRVAANLVREFIHTIQEKQ